MMNRSKGADDRDGGVPPSAAAGDPEAGNFGGDKLLPLTEAGEGAAADRIGTAKAAPGSQDSVKGSATADDSNTIEAVAQPGPMLPRGSYLDADGHVVLGPGAYHVAGPNFRCSGSAASDVEEAGSSSAAFDASARDGSAVDDAVDEEIVLEGYVPEPSDEERREERIRREAEEMLRTAVALDPSAVRVIETTADGKRRARETTADGKRPTSPLFAVCLTLALLLAIALGVALGSRSGSGSAEVSSQPVQPCTAASVQDRYDVARSIVSEITPLEYLDDATSPQARALEWLVCNDQISAGLIDARDSSTGTLPNQPRGTLLGGNTGESQVLRRYALATFFFATSEDGPWGKTLNFLSGDLHECAWHENVTRPNVFFGDFDPVGLVCRSTPFGIGFFLMMDDAGQRIGGMSLNMKIPNNLTGTIPPEFGHLVDLTAVNLENHKGLRGSLPSTLGNLVNLGAFALLNSGPDLGGTIAPLFALPKLQFINMLFNEGSWELPSTIETKGESSLVRVSLRSNGLTGPLPSISSGFKRIQLLELSENDFEGSVPDSFGNLSSLEYLNLHGNKLTGTLPQSLRQLANMSVMFLGKNNFQGPLPTWLGNLGKLELLDLGHNELEGTVPASFAKLSNLEHISLQNNANLTGPITVFESLERLSSLALYSNSFSSTIPAGLFSRLAGKNIIADFGHNNFTGGLPLSLSRQASNTSYLSIMQNGFDDDIVDDEICEEVPVLYADCNSCTCCQFCCDEDSADEDANDAYCHYALDFYHVVGLEYQCLSRGLPMDLNFCAGDRIADDRGQLQFFNP